MTRRQPTTDPKKKTPSDRLCRSRTRAGGECLLPAGHGTGHPGTGRCKLHGGATPQGELGGALVLARRESLAMGRPLDVHPHEAILECVRIAAGEVQYASEQIALLDPDGLVGPVVTTRPLKQSGGSESATVGAREEGPPALNIWVRVRHEAMDRLVHYSKTALAAGVEERRVQVAEHQGSLLAEVIRGVLSDLGVLEHPDAPVVVRRHLATVSASSP